MKNLIYLCFLLCPILSHADTIHVEKAWMQSPVCLEKPYQTDSLNMKGSTYDIQKVFKMNSGLISSPFTAQTEITKRSPLLPTTPSDSSAYYLTALKFTVSADRFTQTNICVNNIKSHKIYVDGKELSGTEIKLLPGHTEIALLCLTRPMDKDSFDISFTGKQLEGLQANPTGKKPYTMAAMMQGKHYSDVMLSPSGKYLITVYYDKKKDGSNLFRTIVTETASGRSVMRPNEYVALRWMPLRDVLYYQRKGHYGQQLVSYNPATGEEQVLTENLPSGSFTMSPTEDYIVLNDTQEGRQYENGLKRMEEPDDKQPGWRNRNALKLYKFKQGVVIPLTFGMASVSLRDISLDGKQLLLTYSRMDTRRMPFHRTAVLSMDVQTLHVDTLLQDTTFIADVSFSPDGRSLLVKASPAAFDGIGAEVAEGQTPNAFDYRLYLYDIRHKTVRPLLCDFAPSVGETVWAPGDGNIYFKATDGCDESLFRLSPTTGKVTHYTLPVSYIQRFSISANSRQPQAAFFGQTGERAREMFVCPLANARPKARLIGDLDFDKMYADYAIGTCHDWKFLSSRGDSISGFYFLPPDFDTSKKYPLIVYYYGGCTPTGKTLEFQYPLQVLAGQGYVVYVCEPSGAIGYGQEFAARHVNTWGQGSADDIIEGTQQFMREHPYIDAKKVGCMGASYGGFMTQYLQTRTDLFAAAISHAGISNIASYWGGGYWGYTYGEVAQYGSYPWNNPDLYVKQSPLFNADKIHTPLLLLHGTADTNVPTDESQQLFTALRILGRPVSYVRIDGENHVIVDYNKRLAWQNVIFAWFAHWLKDQPEWWKALYPEDTFGQQ